MNIEKNEYIEHPPIDSKIDGDFYPEEVEEDERINKNDPFVIEKRKRAFAKKHGGEVYQTMTEVSPRKKNSPKKTVNKVPWEVEFNKWEEYTCRVTKIDDFGNAVIAIKDTKNKGIVYDASKRSLSVWDKKKVLFARENKKGKYVFELPKNP